MLIGIPLYALLMTQSAPAHSRVAPGPKEIESVRRFVQGFYDWYIPIALDDHRREDWQYALRRRGRDFNPTLVRALQEDAAAQAKADDLVGIDADPFMNSQDPDPRYRVGKIRFKGGFFYVDLGRMPDGKHVAERAVIAKVERHGNRWRFTNFIDPDQEWDLLSWLKVLKKDRLRPPPKGSS